MNNDEIKQLELLSVFHYVVGGITALLSCMPFLHVFMGIALLSGALSEGADTSVPPPDFIGWIFVVIGSFAILSGWIIAIFIIIAGKKLKARRSRIFCLVVAGLECMFMPYGTVLGVFTLLLLSKDSVKEAFEESRT